jgi:hypothetical protein
LASLLGEDREPPLLGESIHRVLDRGFHFAIDSVDVFVVVDSLRVVVDVNRMPTTSPTWSSRC